MPCLHSVPIILDCLVKRLPNKILHMKPMLLEKAAGTSTTSTCRGILVRVAGIAVLAVLILAGQMLVTEEITY